MSLSWPEVWSAIVPAAGTRRLLVSLAPDQVHLARCAAFGKPTAFECLPCGEDGASAGGHDGLNPWQPALKALTQHLTQHPASGGWPAPGLEVVLSSHFVRLLMLPWQSSLHSVEERQQYAKGYLRQVHGAAAESWQVSLALAPPGLPAPICAVDGGLVTELQALARSCGYRLTSLQAGLAAAADRLGKAFKGTSVLALAESGRLSSVLVRDGQWQGFASLAMPAAEAGQEWDLSPHWPGLLARLGLPLAEPDSAPRHLYLGQVAGLRLRGEVPAGWTRHALPEAVPGGWLGWSWI